MKQLINRFLVAGLVGVIALGLAHKVSAQAALMANIITPTSGQNITVNQPFNFSGSASGGNATFYSYVWNFGDGSFGAGDTYTKTYTELGPKTISLTVADHDGTQASVSRTINVVSTSTPSNPDTLTITNISVDGITQTSAVIHWTTNLPADSRVIYDTVSHPILGSAPNFGYAFTTGTSDSSPKVTTHAVTVTGLTPNTQYFFRVLSQA